MKTVGNLSFVHETIAGERWARPTRGMALLHKRKKRKAEAFLCVPLLRLD